MKIQDVLGRTIGNKGFFGEITISIRGGVVTRLLEEKSHNLNDLEEAQVTEKVTIPLETYQAFSTIEEVEE